MSLTKDDCLPSGSLKYDSYRVYFPLGIKPEMIIRYITVYDGIKWNFEVNEYVHLKYFKKL